MEESLTADVHRATTWSIVLSVLIMLAGLVAIAVPGLAGVTVTMIVGWLLIFAGIAHFVFAWSAGRAGMVVWEILLGVVYAFIGYYVLAHPVAGLAGLTVAIGIYLVIEGILELAASFQLRPLPGSGWLLFDGVVTLLLAAMIWSTWPSSAAWVVGVLVGVSMFFSGLTRLMLTLQARRMVA